MFVWKVEVLETALILGVACCVCESAEELRGALYPALSCALECYIYVNRTQGNHKKAFSITCQRLLSPCVQLYIVLPTYLKGSECSAIPARLMSVFKSLFRRLVSGMLSHEGHQCIKGLKKYATLIDPVS